MFFVKIQKKKMAGGGGGSWGRVLGGQGGCERRIEVFVKIQKKIGGGGGGGWVGVRVVDGTIDKKQFGGGCLWGQGGCE